MTAPIEIRYLGWSGVAVAGASGSVAVDPFGDAAGWKALPAGALTICLTHGHPEHCGSARALLAGAEPQRLASTDVISSSPVVRHVARGGRLDGRHVHPTQAGERVRLGELQVSTFAWRHLPLLPPESLAAKLHYASQLLRRPGPALGIAATSIRLPMRAPYLGFHLSFDDGRTLLDYAEGLHRLTDPAEVAAVAERLPAETLLFAVEPEDVDAIPRWVEMLRPQTAVIYEAHRPWRELFQLPHLELDGYAEQLGRLIPNVRFHALTEAGQRLQL